MQPGRVRLGRAVQAYGVLRKDVIMPKSKLSGFSLDQLKAEIGRRIVEIDRLIKQRNQLERLLSEIDTLTGRPGRKVGRKKPGRKAAKKAGKAAGKRGNRSWSVSPPQPYGSRELCGPNPFYPCSRTSSVSHKGNGSPAKGFPYASGVR